MSPARSPSGKTLGAMFAAVLICASASAAAQSSSQAQKCVNAKGETYYTNKPAPGDKCSPVTGAISVVPGRPSTISGSTSAPGSTQSSQRDAKQENTQRDIEAAERQLAEARRALAEQEAIRNGDERNYQRVLDRLKPYQDSVAEAEKNLERLRGQASGQR
jgi:hypothetical protein